MKKNKWLKMTAAEKLEYKAARKEKRLATMKAAEAERAVKAARKAEQREAYMHKRYVSDPKKLAAARKQINDILELAKKGQLKTTVRTLLWHSAARLRRVSAGEAPVLISLANRLEELQDPEFFAVENLGTKRARHKARLAIVKQRTNNGTPRKSGPAAVEKPRNLKKAA